VKAKSCFFSVMLLFLFEISSHNALTFAMESLSELEILTKRCIETKGTRECRVALSFAEVLQNQAASNGNFACQSRLLGLESDLIRLSFQAGRDGLGLKMLEEVNMFCNGI